MQAMTIPRLIWCLWFQGWDDAPPLVKACGASWRQCNPDWRIVYVSQANLGAFCDIAADEIYRKGLPSAALSDVIRTDLLHRYGGIWVDATTYCLRPLNGWINQAVVAGFFAFDQPGPDRMLSTWFLASQFKSYIVDALFQRIRLYWTDRNGEPDDYFWFHHIFREAYDTDPEFKRLWDLAPKLSAIAPHYFSPYEVSLPGPVTPSHRLLVETAQTPVIKLTHKLDHSAVSENSTYRWLCARMPSFDGA